MIFKPSSTYALHHDQGSVLIIVLWICLGLVSLTLVFGHSMKMAFRGTDNEVSGRQAEQAIEGAARYALYVLSSLESPGLMPSSDTYQSTQVPVGDAFFWFLGRANDDSTSTTPTFGMVDEASKLNINTATLSMLEALPGMTPEFAAAIIDWRDRDEKITSGGAESETYLSMTPPRSCKNAPFETIEELQLVYGADNTILYGEDTNLNGILDPNENTGNESFMTNTTVAQSPRGVLDYVTVYSREPNKQSTGSSRININRSTTQLTSYLRGKFGNSRASQLLRNAGVGGRTPTVFGSLIQFYIRSGMTEAEFDKISGDLTTRDGKYISGLININTASAAVLACIPGIGADNAAKVVATRATRTDPTKGFAWIVKAIGSQNATRAGPYITDQSWQATVDVAAVGRSGRGYRRTRFVVDFSGTAPQIVYHQNLSSLGWALGADVRQTLAMNSPTTTP
jgi:DNA uptake protein ComE-like DNA-binding protein